MRGDPVDDDVGGAVGAGCGVGRDEMAAVVDGVGELLGAVVTQLTSVVGGGVITAVTMRVTVSMGAKVEEGDALWESAGAPLSPSPTGSNRGVNSPCTFLTATETGKPQTHARSDRVDNMTMIHLGNNGILFTAEEI